MKTDDKELEDLLFYAFRYAIGRSTYVTGHVSELLLKYKEVVSLSLRTLIIREIEQAIKEKRAGMQMDTVEWNKVIEEFKNDGSTSLGNT